jgi:magnesium-protoporphyrin IX monomethyl ester (oxidative) cyclase
MNGLLLVPAPFVHEGAIVPYVPFGLLSLQAAAEKNGPEIDVLQLAAISDRVYSSSDDLARGIADLVQGDRYAAVGLSTMCSSFHHSIGIAVELRRRFPRLRIWMGGPHVSANPRAALAQFPGIDAVFVGEAEETLRDVLAGGRVPEPSFLGGLPGVLTRETPFVPRELVPTLDLLPFIDGARDLVPSVDSSRYTPSEVPVEAERGCSGRCSFCSTSLHWGRRVRRKSIGRLLEEIDRAITLTHRRNVSLIGDDLAGSRSWLLEFCRRAALETPDDLKWGCSLSLSRLRVEDLDVLWAGRCRSMFVGLESASQLTLDRIGKKVDLDRSLVLLDHALEKGFLVHVSLIVGFPWETSSDLKDTYDLHLSLLKRGVRSEMTTLCPLPGTALERDAVVHAGDGMSRTAFDGLAHGPVAEEIIQRCPELFTQLGYFETGRVGSSEVRAIARAASMASNHYLGR